MRCFTWTGGGPDPLSSYALRDIAAGKNLMIVDRVSHADFLAKCIVFMFPHICKHPHIHIYCWPILMVMVMVILMANRRGAQRRLRHLWAPCLACSSLQVCHPLIYWLPWNVIIATTWSSTQARITSSLGSLTWTWTTSNCPKIRSKHFERAKPAKNFYGHLIKDKRKTSSNYLFVWYVAND